MNWLGKYAVAALWLAAAAAASAETPRVKEVATRAPVALASGQAVRPLVLKAIKTRFENPAVRIGEFQDGFFCSPKATVTWNTKLYEQFSPTLSKSFRAELEKAGYPVPVVTDSVFDVPGDKAKPGPQLHVGALIKEVAANFCVRNGATQGGVYMKVFWQVLASDAQKIVFEATTEGTYQPDSAEPGPPWPLFTRAFIAASRNLLADPAFQAAVLATPVTAMAPAAPSELLRLAGAKVSGDALNKNVTLLRSAVATVSNGTGSGTAFFISDGYLLSNQHVVGDAKVVKVTLTTGRELVGEVVRGDRDRDVVLIKTEAAGVPPMPLRPDEANIGDEVYALGSPLGERFNTTLTRGILSGYRTLDEKRFIQSDVAILPGNSGGPLLDSHGAVVGITVMGLGARGLAGMNFFIPIGEALKRLGVEMN